MSRSELAGGQRSKVIAARHRCSEESLREAIQVFFFFFTVRSARGYRCVCVVCSLCVPVNGSADSVEEVGSGRESLR